MPVLFAVFILNRSFRFGEPASSQRLRLVSLPCLASWLIRLVRRHVILGELATRGEIDLLAFLADGRSFLCECKSSSKGLTDRQLDRFLEKVRGFPATRALLLIDSDNRQQMMQRLGQLGQAMYRVYGNGAIGPIQQYAGSTMVQLNETIVVADTGGGLLTTLQAALGAVPKSI